MNGTIKEMIKKHLSDKSKEELLDIATGLLADIMWLNFTTTMADANTHATTQQAKSIMDAIKGDCSAVTRLLCETEKIASPLVNKLRDGGI